MWSAIRTGALCSIIRKKDPSDAIEDEIICRERLKIQASCSGSISLFDGVGIRNEQKP
jgi:hypothetical protein